MARVITPDRCKLKKLYKLYRYELIKSRGILKYVLKYVVRVYMDVMVNDKMGGWGFTYCLCLLGTLSLPDIPFLFYPIN